MNKAGFLYITLCVVFVARPDEWDAQEYAKNCTHQFMHAVKELNKLNFNGHESVIDVGCGNGMLAAYVAQKYVPNGLVHGIDKSTSQMKQACLLQKELYNVSFETADILNFESLHQYDIALSFWTLHWIKDYQNALSAIVQLIQPGGRVLIGHLINNGSPIIESIKKLLYMPPWDNFSKDYFFPLYIPSFETVFTAINNAQLKIIHLEIKENSDFYNNKNEILNKFRSLPLISCIPDIYRDEFLLQAIDMANILMPDGIIRDYALAIIMVLEKLS